VVRFKLAHTSAAGESASVAWQTAKERARQARQVSTEATRRLKESARQTREAAAAADRFRLLQAVRGHQNEEETVLTELRELGELAALAEEEEAVDAGGDAERAGKPPVASGVTCNGVEMVRETGDDANDDIYDYYYFWNDSASLDALEGEEEDEGGLDDDEDSNDENHWANDYPDEEENENEDEWGRGGGGGGRRDEDDGGVAEALDRLGLEDTLERWARGHHDDDEETSSDDDLYGREDHNGLVHSMSRDAALHGASYARFKRRMLRDQNGGEDDAEGTSSDDDELNDYY
jgi:hypothetical protein